jgi:hypothetical protein
MPLAATLNWIIKDGLGQFGGIVFASFVNNQFDANPKRWRMIAGISMDSASFLELLTPLAPAYFLPIAAVANVGKNISFLAASASRAAIHKSFAQHENLADITAKTGSQCIVGSLIGTSLGLSIAASVGQDYASVLTAFATCSALSLGATYYSLKDVTLTTLSLARLDCIMGSYVHGGKVLDPVQVREKEKLLGNFAGLLRVSIGSDLDEVTRNPADLEQMTSLYAAEAYMIGARTTASTEGADKGAAIVHLLFKEGVTQEGILKGLYNSFLLRNMLTERGFSAPNSPVLPAMASLRNSSSKGADDGMAWEYDLVSEAYKNTQANGAGDDFAAQLLSQSRQRRVPAAEKLAPEHVWVVDSLLLESRVARIEIN